MAKTNITVAILGDANSLARSLGQADSKLASFGKKAERVGKNMTTYVTLPIVAAGAASIKWAGELEDSGALAEEVFKGSAADLRAWGKTTAKTLGIAEKDAVEYANQFGLALQNIGKMSESESAKISQELVGLSADLGSAFGTSNEEAFAALRGALTGEYEMLKKYGIVVNETALKQEYFAMTGEQVTGTLNAQQKQQAALSLITQQTSKVQGDFGRNIDGTTNSLKVAQASAVDLGTSVGTTLLPAFNSILSVGQGAVDMFMSLPEPVQQFAVYAGVAAAAAGPLLTVFGKLAQSRAAEAMLNAASSARDVHNAIKGVAATRGVSYFEALRGTARESARSMNQMSRSTKAAGLAVGTLAVSYAAMEIINNVTNSQGRLTDALNNYVVTSDKAGASTEDLLGAFQRMLDEDNDTLRFSNLWSDFGTDIVVGFDGASDAVERVQRQFDVLKDTDPVAAGELLDSLEEVTDGLDENSGQWQANKEFIERNRESMSLAEGAEKALTDATEDNTEAGQDNADATGDQTSALQEYADTLQGTLDPLFGVTDATLDLEDAKRDVAEAQKKVTDLEKIGAKGTAEYEDAVRDLDAAQRGQVRSAADLESATAKLAEDVRTGAVSFDTGAAALDRWAREGKITEGQAEQTKKELFLAAIAAQNLGRQHPTVPVKADARSFWDQARFIQRFKFQPLHVDIRGRVVGGILGEGGLGRRQYGGPVIKGKPYIVGEVGPEIVVPEQSGMVIPNNKIGSSAAGVPSGGLQIVLNFHGPVAGQESARWIAEQVEEAAARGYRMPRLKQSMNA